jgi:ornithine carbamoyltransferase
MLDKGLDAKKRFYARDEDFKPFKGQSMAMIFTKPSARTRVSFETVRLRECDSSNHPTSNGLNLPRESSQ